MPCEGVGDGWNVAVRTGVLLGYCSRRAVVLEARDENFMERGEKGSSGWS